MAKGYNQKKKLLYVMQELLQNTDEEHSLSTKDLIAMLESNGISAERKSIYDDIETLKVFGFDIELKKEAPKGYYMASRQFELAELKLLVDSVQSSKFLTEKKSRELISKIESLGSKYEAKHLQRQVIVSNRIKTMNESIYYNVDDIHKAISEDKQITFKYCEWNVKKELKEKRDGKEYQVSPYALNFNDDNYYLVAYDSESGIIKHYRVDKMKYIRIKKMPRDGKKEFKNFDNAVYTKKKFGMFAGTEETVSLECENRLVGVVIDRFGKDVPIISVDENYFKTRVTVNVSGQFFGWLCGLGKAVRIAEPENVAKEYENYLEEILKSCKN